MWTLDQTTTETAKAVTVQWDGPTTLVLANDTDRVRLPVRGNAAGNVLNGLRHLTQNLRGGAWDATADAFVLRVFTEVAEQWRCEATPAPASGVLTYFGVLRVDGSLLHTIDSRVFLASSFKGAQDTALKGEQVVPVTLTWPERRTP